jgi:hypothetical protein
VAEAGGSSGVTERPDANVQSVIAIAIILLQKWPDAFSPDLAISLNNQFAAMSELERREEGEARSGGPGQPRERSRAYSGLDTARYPAARDTHCLPERRIRSSICAAFVARLFSDHALGSAVSFWRLLPLVSRSPGDVAGAAKKGREGRRSPVLGFYRRFLTAPGPGQRSGHLLLVSGHA